MSAADSYLAQSRLNDMKQHADNIIQGIKAIDENDAKRAIWELFQNAIDLNPECEIEITLADNEFRFKHNGPIFTPETLDCLFKQLSSKTLEERKIEFTETDPVGQYGTGFLTTHAFGKVVKIQSGLQKDADWIPLEAFPLDRSLDNWRLLAEKLDKLRDEVADMLREKESLPPPFPDTEFTYLFDSDTNRERAEDAIQSLEGILPFVMTLNNRLKKVVVHSQNNPPTIYERQELVDLGELWNMGIRINEDSKSVWHLKSEEKQITIILPLDDQKVAYDLGDQMPRFFLFYPLFGTQDFGINFLIHSRNFHPTEPRDALYLETNNENNINEEKANQSLIDSATDLIFSYLSTGSDKIVNPHFLAKTQFKTHSENRKLNDYYKSLKSKWTSHLKELAVVETDKSRIKPSEAIFLDEELLANTAFLDCVYELASKFYDNLPIKGIIKEWIEIAREWEITDLKIVGFNELTSKIEESKRIDCFSPAVLIRFYDLITESGKQSIFSSKDLLPNRKGQLKKFTFLSKSLGISPAIFDLVEEIAPNLQHRIVASEFELTLEFPPFGAKEFIHEMNTTIEEKFKNGIKPEEASENFRNALIRLGSIDQKESSFSGETRMAKYASEFYGIEYYPLSLSSQEKESLETRSLERKMAEFFLTELSTRPSDWIVANLEFIRKVLEVVALDNYRTILSTLKIVPNELHQFMLAGELKVPVDIPPRVRILYNEIVLENGQIEREFVHPKLRDWLNTNHRTGKDLAIKIEEKFFSVGEAGVSVEKSRYKKYILEIISGFNEQINQDRDLRPSYLRETFPLTYANKSKILLELADGDSSYSILSLSPEQIKKLGQLAQDPARLNEIIRLGEDAQLTEEQKKSDFAHKNMIGTRVEGIFRNGLSNQISDPNRFKFENVQNGQDIIIFLDKEPFYYIEVKSRWAPGSPIRMSGPQTLKAFRNKDRYALCTIDMTKLPNDARKEANGLEELSPVIKINVDIGTKVEHLVDVFNSSEDDEKFHIGGDFRTYIPQWYIDEGISIAKFETFLNQSMLNYAIPNQ